MLFLAEKAKFWVTCLQRSASNESTLQPVDNPVNDSFAEMLQQETRKSYNWLDYCNFLGYTLTN